MSGVLTILEQYAQCSFRGVPFAVIGSGGNTGRRIAVHEYPNRDTPWPEDIGRKARTFRVRGFVSGVLFRSQFDLVLLAVEQQGPGLLVHPTRGIIQAAVLNFDWREPDGISGVIEFEVEFIEAKSLLSTTVLAAASAVIATTAALLGSSSTSDYSSSTTAGYALGTTVASAAASTAGNWAAQAEALALTPAVTSAALAGLPTYYGRYVSGNATVTSSDATVASALDDVVTGQAAVAVAIAAVSAAGDAATLAAAVLATSEALRALVADPALQVQLLAQLAAYEPAPFASSAPIGAAIATAETAAGTLCRRAALVSIALACAAYSPTSSNEAEALRQQVAALFADEILIAADGRDAATFQAVRKLRTQVLQDLASRASQLPALVSVTRNEPLPAPVLGQQLYADGSRAPDLIRRANPIHPAFMPVTFEALAT